jgi:hypothetical protein
MKYTFKNKPVEREVIEAIVPSRYRYILDKLEYVFSGMEDGNTTISVDLWLGMDSGNTYLDVFYQRMLGEPLYKRLAVAHFSIEKKGGTSLETIVTITNGETDDRYTTYLDIEIPSPKKLENVLLRCM